ncbi:hypothetical protein ASC94_09145 [Massilia sp. Root418]|uniref:DUF7696 family protein n=1 Tax=Massilia sp. Root418 TaxID=1736532 RepID=UPI0006FFAF59|nr:hypothetical protein [Massilia sp. Root418]KQW96962.1 hypothetical protein ASC94_09145 [Massilia sp. Root418]
MAHSAVELDTSSPEWMLVCLARHVCRQPSRPERQALIESLGAKHSNEFVEQLKNLIAEQWDLVRLAMEICQLPNKPARHARLAALRAAHPEEFVMQIEKQVLTEWALKHKTYANGKAAHGNT